MNLQNSMTKKMRLYFSGTLVIFLLTLSVIYPWCHTGDFVNHTIWAMQMNSYGWDYMTDVISYPIWHILTQIICKVFHFGETESAAASTALFNCLAYWSILFAWDRLGKKTLNIADKIFWSICLLIMGPLFAPGFNQYYYLGQGTGNVWHSPTHFAVKGFAVFSFVWIILLLEKEKIEKRYWFILCALLTLSVLAKPSFLQAMIPGLGFYMVVTLIANRDRKLIKKYALIAAAFIPSVLILSRQFIVNFYADTTIHEGSGIGIAYGEFLHTYTDNLFISFLLALAFPVFFLLIDARWLLKDTAIRIVCCYGGAAWMESVFLVEKGARYKDGNWTWGYNLALLVIWTVFLIRFFDRIQDKEIGKEKRRMLLWLGFPILAFQIVFGILYCNQYYQTGIF